MPDKSYLLSQNNDMERIIFGFTDEYYFPYITVDIENPITHLTSVNVKTIIDTGASYCLLKNEIIEYLKLSSFRKSEIINPIYKRRETDNYFVDVIIDANNSEGSARMKGIRVNTLLDTSYPCGMIIGAELLQHCIFEYNGINKHFKITFKF